MNHYLILEKINWFICFAIILVASLLFSSTLPSDALFASASTLTSEALFIMLISYLLLPAAKTPGSLLANSLSSIAILGFIYLFTGTTEIPVNIFIQVCITIFFLSTLLWSLNQFAELVFPDKKNNRSALFLLVVIITASPVWLAPLVDSYQPDNSVINFIVSVTPVTHISVASEYDYLRSEWLYQNTPFGSLPFVYPDLTSIIFYYLLFATSLQIILWRLKRPIHTLKISKTVKT